MHRYKNQKAVGEGCYGSVFRAENKTDGSVVAIKKMKQQFFSWKECVDLREVASLRKLKHPNIVKLKEVIRENNELFFVFEFVARNLYQLTQKQKMIPEARVKKYVYQVLHALEYMHKVGYFHRDMKPENLLVGSDDTVKIADFGLARETRSRPPYTEYVSTRWYRAPEVILHDTRYSSKVDVFAVGCIMAELFTSRPLFPGSNESDQLMKICSVLGAPTDKKASENDTRFWPEGLKLASQANIKINKSYVKTPFKDLVPNASSKAHLLLDRMLRWDPSKRCTAAQALEDEWFEGMTLEKANAAQANGPTTTTATTSTSNSNTNNSSINSNSPGHQIQLPSNSFSKSKSFGSQMKGSLRSNTNAHQQLKPRNTFKTNNNNNLGVKGKPPPKGGGRTLRGRESAFKNSAASQLGLGGGGVSAPLASSKSGIAGLSFSKFTRSKNY